jgi:hypothetical protein
MANFLSNLYTNNICKGEEGAKYQFCHSFSKLNKIGGGEKMKKKIFGIVFLIIALLILSSIPVYAGYGQEKLSIKIEVGSTEDGSYDKYWNCGEKFVGPYTRVSQLRSGNWGTSETHSGFLIVVDEGGVYEVTFDDDDITYSCSYDAKFRNVFFGQEALPYVIMQIRVRERFEIDNGDFVGYIENVIVDTVYDYANLYEGTNGGGSFVGHGEINGQKIKLSGDSILVGGLLPVREGMVMGWP